MSTEEQAQPHSSYVNPRDESQSSSNNENTFLEDSMEKNGSKKSVQMAYYSSTKMDNVFEKLKHTSMILKAMGNNSNRTGLFFS